MYHVYSYICDPETVKLKLVTPILEFGTAKQSRCSSHGKNSEWSANIQLVRIGLVKIVQ
jgi:hypothetical protein